MKHVSWFLYSTLLSRVLAVYLHINQIQYRWEERKKIGSPQQNREEKCDYWDGILHCSGICGRGILEGHIVEIQACCGS